MNTYSRLVSDQKLRLLPPLSFCLFSIFSGIFLSFLFFLFGICDGSATLPSMQKNSGQCGCFFSRVGLCRVGVGRKVPGGIFLFPGLGVLP
jgi:hypothetical protein